MEGELYAASRDTVASDNGKVTSCDDLECTGRRTGERSDLRGREGSGAKSVSGLFSRLSPRWCPGGAERVTRA